MKRWQIASVAFFIIAIMVAGGSAYWYQSRTQVQQRVFVYQYFESQDNWDPGTAFDSSIVSLMNLYEPLLRINPPGSSQQFAPVLATSWDESTDGMTWTFHLRQGVKFHSGNPMTAGDVKFSIDREVRMGAGAAYIWSAVKQINVIDNYTVQFQLSYPAGLDLIAAAQYGGYIMDSKLLQSIGDDNATVAWFAQGKDAGTGAYMLEQVVSPLEVHFARFHDYWGGWSSNPNPIEHAVLRIVEEPTTSVQSLEGGEVQWISSIAINQIAGLKANPNLQIAEFPSYANTWIDLNVKKDPTNDTLVRKALAYSFPYDQIVNNIFQGHITQAQGVVPKGIWGHDDHLFQYSYDPSKAQDLLAQAGWTVKDANGILTKPGSDGRELRITVADSAGSEDRVRAIELWATTLKSLGFDVTIQITPWDTHWSRGKNLATAAQVWFLGWWPTYITPYDSLYEFYTETTPYFNMAYYYNSSFDKLLDEALPLEATDRTQAAQIYAQAQQKLIDDCPAIFAWDSNRIYAFSKAIGGYQPNPAYDPEVFLYQLYWTSFTPTNYAPTNSTSTNST